MKFARSLMSGMSKPMCAGALALAVLLETASHAGAQVATYTPGAYGLWPSSTPISAETTACSPTGNGRALMHNKGVVGIPLSVSWRDVETADGILDWCQAQLRLQEAQACGLAVALSLGISLQNTPSWLTVDSGGTGVSDYGAQLVNLPNFGTVPVFWDPRTFFEAWSGDARTQANSGNPCPITNPGRAAMRPVFTNTTVSMGGTPRP
jgi:hypothetical protein